MYIKPRVVAQVPKWAEGGMKIGGLEVRTSEGVPRDEIWFAERVGYEKQESTDAHGWALRIYERFRIVGKILTVR